MVNIWRNVLIQETSSIKKNRWDNSLIIILITFIMLDPSDWYFPQFLTVHCIRCKCMLKIWHSIIFAANYYIIRLFFRQFLECWFNIFKKHNAYDFHDYHWIIWGQIMNLTTSLLNNFMQELIQSEYCVQNHDNAKRFSIK